MTVCVCVCVCAWSPCLLCKCVSVCRPVFLSWISHCPADSPSVCALLIVMVMSCCDLSLSYCLCFLCVSHSFFICLGHPLCLSFLLQCIMSAVQTIPLFFPFLLHTQYILFFLMLKVSLSFPCIHAVFSSKLIVSSQLPWWSLQGFFC